MDTAPAELTDDHTFHLIADLFEDDGWRLTARRTLTGFAVDVTRVSIESFCLRDYAQGATPGEAALIAFRRYLDLP